MPPETRFQEIKRYVRFDERDAELLRELGQLASPEFPRIATEFYDRIREHQDAHDVFTGEAQIERLKGSLVAWLGRVCGGRYDEAYHAQTSKIGQMHVRIGLPQRYMLTAMALIRIALSRIAELKLAERAGATREALTRVLDLELAVMLDAYQESFTERLRQNERQERLNLGSALARAERRYVSAVELASVIIVGLDRQGRVQLFNREAERVSGFSRDEVMGKAFADVLGVEDDTRQLSAKLDEGLGGDEAPLTFEGRLRTRSGKLRDVVWSISVTGEAADEEVVVFAMGRDLTDERAMKERARRAEKLAAIGTLAAGLAHEIRNPLNGAQLHVSFLQRALTRKSGDPEMLEATRVVGEEIKRLAQLVTEFLDFARPHPLQLSAVSLQKLCERACGLVSESAGRANVRLTCDAPTADVEFQADSAKLTQVLLNLLNNAIEAVAGGGGGHVCVRGRRGPRHVFLDVEDDGPGLSSADAPIFDAFYSTKEGGTGLGLAITHRIVTDHRGSIDVSSQDGKTMFRISLPLE